MIWLLKHTHTQTNTHTHTHRHTLTHGRTRQGWWQLEFWARVWDRTCVSCPASDVHRKFGGGVECIKDPPCCNTLITPRGIVCCGGRPHARG